MFSTKMGIPETHIGSFRYTFNSTCFLQGGKQVDKMEAYEIPAFVCRGTEYKSWNIMWHIRVMSH